MITMNDWYRIKINNTQIEATTHKAILIKLPHSSRYDGFMFWHPIKLAKDKGFQIAICFTKDFEFTIRRYGSRYKVLDEKKINVEQLLEAFGKQLEHDQQFPKKYKVPATLF